MINVSIIVPVYNVEAYISRCLDSLCNQTLSSIEIICIDDGSSDNSFVKLEDYQMKDNRINIISNIENRGVAYSRNRGIELAKGEYIGFVDSDDWLDLDFYEKLYRAAKAENADIAKGDIYIVAGDNLHRTGLTNENIRYSIENNEFVGISFSGYFYTAIYKSEILKGKVEFPPLINGEDNVFMLRANLQAKKYALVDDVNYYYFQRQGSANFGGWNESKFNSDLEHSALLATILNSSNLAKNDYLKYFSKVLLNNIVNYSYLTVLPSTYLLKHFKLDLIYTLRDIYLNCNYLNELKENYLQPYFSVLEQEKITVTDFENALSSVGKIQYLDNRANNYVLKYYLFGIPVVYRKKMQNVTRIRFLGLPFIKIEKNNGYKRIFLFGFIRIYKQQLI